MIVVSDTSPVSNLIECGLLDLLPSLYGKVIIPAAVQRELSELVSHDPAYDVATHAWMQIREVCDTKERPACSDPSP